MDKTDLQKAHRYFAATTFNACWQLIDLPKRITAENYEMARLAETSFWHWMQVSEHTAENESISLWLLARVYTLSGELGKAAEYARRCIQKSKDANLGPFHRGYALEASARIQQAQGSHKECQETLHTAWLLVADIKDLESRELLETDLRDIAAKN